MDSISESIRATGCLTDDLSKQIECSKPLSSYIIFTTQKKSEHWDALKKDFNKIGIPQKIIDSLASVPLIETALDDGAITSDEKDKLLHAMKKLRLLTFEIDPKLEELWVPFKGRTQFLIVWTVYLRNICRQLLPEDQEVFKALVIGSCKFMIHTIGGFLKTDDLVDRVWIAIESAFANDFISFRIRK